MLKDVDPESGIPVGIRGQIAGLGDRELDSGSETLKALLGDGQHAWREIEAYAMHSGGPFEQFGGHLPVPQPISMTGPSWTRSPRASAINGAWPPGFVVIVSDRSGGRIVGELLEELPLQFLRHRVRRASLARDASLSWRDRRAS